MSNRRYSKQANQLIRASQLYLDELLDAPEYWRIVQAINRDMVMEVKMPKSDCPIYDEKTDEVYKP